jgi:hypothetical protein
MHGVWEFFFALCRHYAGVLIGLILCFLLGSIAHRWWNAIVSRWFGYLAGVSLLAFFLYESILKAPLYAGSHRFGESPAFTVWAILIVQSILAGLLYWRDIRGLFPLSLKRCRLAGVLFLLVVQPLIGALGTNSPIFAKGIEYMPPWFALIILLGYAVSIKIDTPSFLWHLFLLVTVLFAQSQIVFGFFYFPNRLPTRLEHQSEPIEGVPILSDIRVDRYTKAFFETMQRTLAHETNFEPGDPMLGIYDLPGLVYALGGSSPGVWMSGLREEQARNCRALKLSKLSNLSETIILMNDEIKPEFLACMHELGISYPENFRLLGIVSNPYGPLYTGDKAKWSVAIAVPKKT